MTDWLFPNPAPSVACDPEPEGQGASRASCADLSPPPARGRARSIPRAEHPLSRNCIDPKALKVLYGLHRRGYQACLVGGSVRDVLLGRKPKDFDVATDARPEEVQALFRHCRLIGRRFRLAHVPFKEGIIEVATFRGGGPSPGGKGGKLRSEKGLILRDNVYGTQEEDAFRRDFTVNALYYDIADFSVVDYVGGMEDLRAGRVRLIGDPEARYCEDPVRMLRTVRFAAKLGFFIEAGTAAPILRMSPLLAEVPPARLFEEVNKLFLSGTGVASYQMLRRFRLFEHLHPETAELLLEEDSRFPHTFLAQVFEDTDRRVVAGLPVTPAFLFAALLWHPFEHKRWILEREGWGADNALQKAAGRVLRRQARQVAIPRRFTEKVRDIWDLQDRMERFWGKRKRALRLIRHPRFRAALDFLGVRGRSGEADPELVIWWKDLVDSSTGKCPNHLGMESGTRRGGEGQRSA